MKFYDCLFQHIDNCFIRDKEAKKAVDEFIKLIPGRVLEIDFDLKKSDKKGIKKDEQLYKLSINASEGIAFLEFYENHNQGMPTLAIYAEKNAPSLIIKGTKIEKKFILKFTCENGVVKKYSNLE